MSANSLLGITALSIGLLLSGCKKPPSQTAAPPAHAKNDWFAKVMDAVLGWFFRLFNRGLIARQEATPAP